MRKSSASCMVEVRRSPIQGLGVFALRRIRKAATVIQYIGERIDLVEAEQRYDDDNPRGSQTYLMEVDDNTFIDGAVGGNESKYINHSCSPNCAAYLDGSDICIVAIRNIQPEVELTFDYRLELFGNRRARKDLHVCNCGSANCRGTLLKRVRNRGVRSIEPAEFRTRFGSWPIH